MCSPLRLFFALLLCAATAAAQPSHLSEEPGQAATLPASAEIQSAGPTAPEPMASGPALTIDECVARALNKNFDLRIQQFNTANAKESVVIAKANFDPSLQLTTQRFHNRSPQVSSVLDPSGNIITGVPYSQDGDATHLSVTQPLITGTTVTAGGNLNRTRSIPQSTFLDPAYDSDVSLSVRQPLLRNAGSKVNRATIQRARLGIDLANLDFKSAVLTVVRNVEAAYFNLAFAREQLAVRHFSLQIAQSLLEENRTRHMTGVATDLDVLQGEVGVANARRSLLLAEQAVHDREDELISQTEPFAFSSNSIGAVLLPDDPIPVLNGDVSYKRARENTPDLASSQTLIQQLKLDAEVARNNRLPTLDLGGTVGYSAEQKSYSSAVRNLWNGDGYNWQIDATLSLPWGLRADRARYRQSLLGLNREQTHLEQIDQNVLVQVRAAVRAVNTNKESVEISSLATQLSRRQYELEKARYEAGLSTFRRVQESQADWDTARVDELQARVALRAALADLAKLEGSSLQRYKIKLDQ